MSDFLDLESLVKRATSTYRNRCSSNADWVVAAPGRVNLIGEHTDYNDGFVLPMAIDRYTVIAAGAVAPSDSVARVFSSNMNEEQLIPLDRVDDSLPTWAKYVQGVIQVFRSESIVPEPFYAMVDSCVPLGGGLSSSAALEVSVATLLEQMTESRLEPKRKALLCQRAEHEGVGMPCGIMDQFTSVMSRANHLMLLDCRSQQVEFIPLTDPGIRVLIINSNVKHELTGSEYAERRQQCRAAAKVLGVASLRDVTPHQLQGAAGRLEPVLLQRARHVVGEIDRTLRAAGAIRGADWKLAGQLMYASHESLRDDYEVSCAELDCLVEAARQLGASGGVYGSRMTGGGFGGCTVSLVEARQARSISASIRETYLSQCGIEPTAFVTSPANGATAVKNGAS